MSLGVSVRWLARSTPYPWPWNGDLVGAGTAVAVVAPRHSPLVPTAGELAAMRDVARAVRAAGGLVIVVTTGPPARPGSLRPIGRTGFVDVLIDDKHVDHRVDADGIDAFCGSRLEGLLRSERIDRVVLVGVGLETSVHSTMRSANDRGFECLLVVDATTAHEPTLIAPSVSMIEMSGGIFGAVADARDVTTAFTNAQKENRP